ncbi:hypothetical protein [Chroococcidiopsis sp. SAG 2025]|uniref:hypothetical protein n=1 Tax=Chroococcidiopsis sp. SAG 2025 TaxID=171389 RepID=UPI0029373892|nr:hypothetical protein [Chroococcidiopsis sp. SAG 2025]
MSSGRGLFLNYFLAFFLVFYLQNKKKSNLLISLPIICLAAIFLFYGKHIFFSLTGLPDGYEAVVQKFTDSLEYSDSVDESSSQFNLYTLMGNFAAPVLSLDISFEKLYDLRLFSDWIYGFISFIPEKLIPFEKPETVSDYNTRYIVGSNEFEIPPGFLAFGIYSLSWFGLVIVAFTYGWISRYLQNVLDRHYDKIYWMPFLYVLTAQALMDFQMYGDPRVFLKGYFWYLLSAVFLVFVVSNVSIARHSDRQVHSK